MLIMSNLNKLIDEIDDEINSLEARLEYLKAEFEKLWKQKQEECIHRWITKGIVYCVMCGVKCPTQEEI